MTPIKTHIFYIFVTILGLFACSHNPATSTSKKTSLNDSNKLAFGSCDIIANDVAYATECARKQAILNLANSISSKVEGVVLLSASKDGQKITYNISEESTINLDDIQYTEPYIKDGFVSISAFINLEKFKQSILRKMKIEAERLNHKKPNQIRLALIELDKIESIITALYPETPFVDENTIINAKNKVNAYIDLHKYFNASNNPCVARAIKNEGFKLTSKPKATDVSVNYVEQIKTLKEKNGIYLSSGLATIRLSSKDLNDELKTDTFNFYAPYAVDAQKRLKAKLGLECELLLKEYLNR